MTPNRQLACTGRIGQATLAAALSLLTAGNLAAQDTEVIDGLKISRSSVTGRANFVTSADGGAIAVPAAAGRAVTGPIDFFHQHGRLFGVSDPAAQLVVDKAELGLLGQTHTTFKQMHHGLPVFGGVLKVHQSADGSFLAANGDFFPVPDELQTVPTIQTQAAVDIAVKALAQGQPIAVRSDLLIVDPGWYGDPAIGAHLAYHVVLQDQAAGIMEAFFVDAHTGAILDRWSMIHTARVRRIHDAGLQFVLPGTLVRVETQAPTGVADVDAAYDYLGDTYDYFSRAFGRDSINDAGMFITATVRLGSTANFGCPNAFWNGSQMAFCAGVAADDVVGHEYTHGVTQFTADLIYQNQSGQLNESYSDIFGELVDLFNGDAAFSGVIGGTPAWPTHPTGPGLDTPNGARSMCSNSGLGGSFPDGVRWLIGEDAGFGDAIRDMWDPPCKNSPDTANSPLQTCGLPDQPPRDNGGVHSGSGVPNHAFAMLTDGKTFNGFTVNGIGPIKAGAVWYRALTVYLTRLSDFRDAFTALNKAADDLVGTTPNDPRTGSPSTLPLSEFTVEDAAQVENALLAVEMNTPGRCGSGGPSPAGPDMILLPDPAPTCPDAVTIFADDFESGASGWTLGLSGPPSPEDWALLAEPLPVGRTGTVWFVRNKDDGNCAQVDESATHSLVSPMIRMPANIDHPLMSFTHHMKCQPGWDGGNIRIRVNGGSWDAVPRTAIDFNPYNARLNSAAQGSTNPAAGQDAWSGEGIDWGTSVVDLTSPDLTTPVSAGDTLEVRFDFNTDCDGGLEGWYVDDFAVYTCPDCDGDGLSDDREFHFSASSPTLVGLVGGQTETFTINNPPLAASGSDVTLFFVASGNLEPVQQAVQVNIRFPSLTNFVFRSGATSCPTMNALTPDSEILKIPAADFNDAASFGSVVFDLRPTANIGTGSCGGESFLNVFIKYEVQVADCDGNMILDACEPDCNNNGMADVCETDADGDGVIDACDLCPGGNDLDDADGDGVPDACDLCARADDALDSDGDGVPDCLDNCPNVPNADQADSAGGGTGDACRDCNGNGAVDLDELANGTSQDCNGDMIPDECGPKPVEAHAGADVTIGEGQSIRMGDRPAATGTTPPYAFQWALPGDPRGEVSTLANPTYGPLPPGVHVATLLVTGSTGCTATASVIVTVEAAPTQTTTPLPVAPIPTAMPANNPCGGLFGPPAALMLTVMIIGQRKTPRRRRRSP